jgi:WD40 repeat protein
MNPKQLQRCQNFLQHPPALMGNWLQSWAIRKLQRDASPEAVTILANIAATTPTARLRGKILEALQTLSQPEAIDALCAVWLETRAQDLAHLLRAKSWIASAPIRVKVFTALLNTQWSVVAEGGPAIVAPLLEACRDQDTAIATQAACAIGKIKSSATIDALCARWVEKREPWVEEAIVSSGYLAQKPVRIRAFTLCKLGRIDLLQSGGPEWIEPLVEAAQDRDPAIAENAAAVLLHLDAPEARDALCRLAMEKEQSLARDLCLRAGYAPRDAHQRALFFFLTEQWSEYESLDFDQRLLAAAYELGDRKLRGRIAELTRRAGRSEWLTSIAGMRQDRRLSEMSFEEWDTAHSILMENRRWPELWQLAQAAPAAQSARLLRSLRQSQWTPPAHEASGFEQMLDLAQKLADAGASSSADRNALDGLTRCQRILEGHSDAVTALQVSPDGQSIVSSSNDMTLRIWSFTETRHVLGGHTDWISTIAISPNGQLIASGSRDQSVRLWQLSDGRKLPLLAGHAGEVRAVQFSPDSTLLASAGDDKTVRLWRTRDGQSLQIIEGHNEVVSCLAFSPDGRLLASGSYDQDVRLWSLPEGGLVGTLQGHKALVNCVAFAPDGRLLVSGSKDRSLLLWGLPAGKELIRLKGHKDDITCLAISPNGSILASGSWDNTIRLWNLPDGEPLHLLGSLGTMDGHTGWITNLAFSPDSLILASASVDGTARLWCVTTGRQIKALEGHEERVACLGFTRDGATLVTGSWDKTLRIWRSELNRLRSLPIARTSIDDLAWAEDQLLNARLDTNERQWLELCVALMRWRRRHDIALAETAHIEIGEFDIEIEG